MENNTLHSPAAVTYAKALMELAGERAENPGLPETLGGELASLRQVVVDEPAIGALFSDPSIGLEERSALIERVFANRIDPLLLKFLQVLNEKSRMGLLVHICGAYHELLDQRLGKVEVDVTAAYRMDEAQFENVRGRIAAALKRDVVMHQYVNESILGGLIL